jgi:starch phosphorylase
MVGDDGDAEAHADGALIGQLELQGPGAALRTLAYNLRWSWHPPTMDLFASLARQAWVATRNPIAVLRAVEREPHLLTAHAARILHLRIDLERYLRRPSRIPAAPSVAYLSAEFSIAECLPIYSGGLGVLAGDHLKSASDLGLPLVGVSLLYRYGYFRQIIDDTGYQRERYDHLNTEDVPLEPVRNADGSTLIVPLAFPGRTVFARAWLAQVGRIPLYLLDTELPENREDDRWITGHLYGGDQDTRIRQELVLGVGGARLLRAVLPHDAQPRVFHMNEGHSAFITLELARELVTAGAVFSLTDGLTENAYSLAFTTHTPVAAGHDEFPSDLVDAYFCAYRQQLGISQAELMRFGRREPEGDGKFNMTVLAARGAAYRNGVSQLHARVSRHMLAGIGIGLRNLPPVREMDGITNGVHTSTWAGPELSTLYDAQLGSAWREAPDDKDSWSRLAEVDRGALWAARTAQRRRLLEFAGAGARAEGRLRWGPEVTPERALVVGFARRFATYKRAGLLLADADRLARLIAGDRPVVIVFAGKAHPRDDPAKLLLQRIVQASHNPRFRGRLVFLENYGVELARLMVQGCDVWLNTPRRPMEASGTSGMKAVLNGSLHLSELDGWWDEGYRPGLGWALGSNIPGGLDDDALDAAEGHQLMHFLEREVVPLYFDRDETALPVAWLERVIASVSTLAPAFSSQHMVREYTERFYIPAGTVATRLR